MALVIKSWQANSSTAPGEPYVSIVGRESGLLSFVLSLLGIDATVKLQVTARHVFFEVGSLAGFNRLFVPLEHVCSSFYGRHKPWKVTLFLVLLSLMLGISCIGGGGTGLIVFGTLILFGGVGLSFLYYFLNRQLTIGFTDVSGHSRGLVFKRSVIEGQEIDERATESVILIIEHLIKPTEGITLNNLALGESAPTQSSATSRSAPASKRCPGCGTANAAGNVFCDNCGHNLR